MITMDTRKNTLLTILFNIRLPPLLDYSNLFFQNVIANKTNQAVQFATSQSNILYF